MAAANVLQTFVPDMRAASPADAAIEPVPCSLGSLGIAHKMRQLELHFIVSHCHNCICHLCSKRYGFLKR